VDLNGIDGTIAPVGARTQWETGGAPPVGATEVRAPAGITAWEPADLTVTCGAGTPYRDLAAELASRGQEVPLDPVDPGATVGGILACGTSGLRRLRLGPVRDHVLQVWVITGDGRRVRGGGPTVKNVTGYDLPRLLVGSLGTLGLIETVTLRCRPLPQAAQWFRTADGSRCFRPTARIVADAGEGAGESVLLEGRQVDIDAQSREFGLEPVAEPPAAPEGPHRGRISVPPERVRDLLRILPVGARVRAELGVGTLVVAVDSVADFTACRAAARSVGGWMLREAGGPADDDGFGVSPVAPRLAARIRAAFDPAGRMNPGRLPFEAAGALR
jgi:glycolate oxidase FAD binding subunit